MNTSHTAQSFEEVLVDRAQFAERSGMLTAAGHQLVLMYATDDVEVFTVRAVFSKPQAGFMTVVTTVPVTDPTYPALTKTIMAAHWFERLLHDQFGIVAVGHPDWRRLMHHENIPAQTYPLRKKFAWNTKLPHANEPYPMHAVQGKGVYEIPVGPIHAGIIEPGHFRFNVRGERILTLEGKLFFKHKGVEKLLEGKTPQEAMPFIEQISGDMPVSHALAFCEAVERVSGTVVSERAQNLRVVWNELERVTGHVFDIGNMGGMGTGFTFMAAQAFRMVEELRRVYADVVGHRYLRGAIVLGGAHDITPHQAHIIRAQLETVLHELTTVLDVAYAKDGLMERFESTGVLSHDAARAYGARGVPARASGVTCDMRHDHPYAGYRTHRVPLMTKKTGDVRARFSVRALELSVSIPLILKLLENLGSGNPREVVVSRAGSALGWAESFRGGVIDWVRLDAQGKIDRCAISDPSFANWPLFGEIGPGNIVPDFPLCNKSLNLSYSGTDL